MNTTGAAGRRPAGGGHVDDVAAGMAVDLDDAAVDAGLVRRPAAPPVSQAPGGSGSARGG